MQVAVKIIGYAAIVTLAFLIAWSARWATWRVGLHRQQRREMLARAGAGSAAPVKHLRAKRFYAWLVSEPIAPVVAALVVYFGVFAISWTASMVMNSMILYYRYLFVAIGPLLFAAAAVLSHVHTKPLVAGVVAVTLCASVANQALLLRDDYDPANNVPIEKFRETVDSVSEQIGGQMPLVVSTDIGYMGVTACMCEDVPQTYMDWQKGNWDRAYMAYSPTLVSKKSWEIIFDNFHGTFICTGQAQNDSLPRDISDLSQKDGFTLLEYHTYYRPYERTWMTIAVMTKQ